MRRDYIIFILEVFAYSLFAYAFIYGCFESYEKNILLYDVQPITCETLIRQGTTLRYLPARCLNPLLLNVEHVQ